MAHHNKELLQKVRRDQDMGCCEQWLSIKDEPDYLYPMEKRQGLLVRCTGCFVFEYLCVATEVPLAEIFFCIHASPVVIQGAIGYANLDSLVTTLHPEIIPYS